MRRLSLLLLASFRPCNARDAGFSIHNDLLTFPQFEVVFSDGFIEESDVKDIMEKNRATRGIYTADFSHPTVEKMSVEDTREADSTTDSPLATSYEVMNMPPNRYFCSIPPIQPSIPENQTANELAKAEEERELSRAAVKGWELLKRLEDYCLYFMSGWWSYSFCNNREIVQFHALATLSNGQPPRRDPHTAEFILGRTSVIPDTDEHHTRRYSSDVSLPAELQVKGDQRYLVQKLEGGTICDLTGRERTIEVQYHCVPGMKSDRISWIKEVTICAYIMVVNTPHLCDDVAFLPPQETKANAITCQRIGSNDEAAAQLPEKEISSKQDVTTSTADGETHRDEMLKQSAVSVGGVVVGGRKVLSGADEVGKPPMRLGPPRGSWPVAEGNGESLVDVLVRAASKEDGGKINMPSAQELEQMDIDPEVVEEMKEKMVQMAGENGWRLEIFQMKGRSTRELRGTVDGEVFGDKDDRQDKGKAKVEQGNTDGNEAGSHEELFHEEL